MAGLSRPRPFGRRQALTPNRGSAALYAVAERRIGSGPANSKPGKLAGQPMPIAPVRTPTASMTTEMTAVRQRTFLW